MTDEPNLRARALDAAAQALNAGGYWLPTDGQAAVVDAVLAVCEATGTVQAPLEAGTPDTAPCAATSPSSGPINGRPCELPAGHNGAHTAFLRLRPDHAARSSWHTQPPTT